MSNLPKSERETWVQWFCKLPGHQYFCEVDKNYMKEGFNLYGIRPYIPQYQKNMRIILDEAENESITHIPASCVDLYGLIHARFILTSKGIEKMLLKYRQKHFGACPNECCDETVLLPVGLYDDIEIEYVRLYCPSCGNIYKSPYQIDGGYFGSTFAHLFTLIFPEIKKTVKNKMNIKNKHPYVPRIFGYRVHTSKQLDIESSTNTETNIEKKENKEKEESNGSTPKKRKS